MTEHTAWIADAFLLGEGFVIIDPGPDQRRTATRRGLSFDLEPLCRCPYCPAPTSRRYRRLYVEAA
jgi:hypothetical protein